MSTTQYQIQIQTADEHNAGTDADVFIQLNGSRCSSTPCKLDNPNTDDFEQGRLDTFTISTDNVGWVESIRLFHNNKNDKPGWKVDWVKAAQVSNGLNWRADFYRWLAKDECDGALDVSIGVPIPNVSLESGSIKRVYLGYSPIRIKNDLPNQSLDETLTFYSSVQQGVSCGLSTATTATAGMQLDATFFGIGSKFSLQVTQSAAQQLNSTEQHTTSFEISEQITVPPATAITVIEIYYQIFLEGYARAGDVKFSWDDKREVTHDTIWCVGWLSDQEIEQKVMQALGLAFGLQPMLLPQQNPVPIPLATRKLGSLLQSDIHKAQALFPKMKDKVEDLETRHKIHLLMDSNRSIKVSKTPTVFHAIAAMHATSTQSDLVGI